MTAYQLDLGAPAAAFELEKSDPSLGNQAAGSLAKIVPTSLADLERWFFARYRLEYLPRYFAEHGLPFRVLTHPRTTKTCFEKCELLGGWDPLDTIKALYFEDERGALFVVVIPETGCFVDRAHVAALLGRSEIRKASRLPRHMDFGTCSPFIDREDAAGNGGRVTQILFDRETVELTSSEVSLDDFSFGLDHRMSLQINYARCFDALRATFGDLVQPVDLLPLSFKEVLVRHKGRIKIDYEFNSLNYRTAKSLSTLHGSGDVTIVNDFVDELDLPDAVRRRTPPRGFEAVTEDGTPEKPSRR